MADKDKDGVPPIAAGILARDSGASIAYKRLSGKGPGIVFLHGFHSDMEGTKALALEAMCRAQGRAFVRFDLFGHGTSSGKVEDGCISRWAEDAVAVLDQLTEGPQVLVGSSLGGWLALLAALRRRDRVVGLVGIAAAPDFTEDLMWADFTDQQRRDLLEQGFVTMENCYEPENPWRIPRLLIEDGRNNLLLVDNINLSCPVRLIQGQKDADVPWQTALKIADRLESPDVEVILVKDGDHRLSRDHDLERLVAVVERLVTAI
ncbi:alpha/beta fold hydrolase [Magnetospirillum moscoviense]|uniref:Palmitoyl-protein thioesterase ABHD10, mitochondrial n=1 Tax=Magnetospirillum moscoviense TaxID=1437059 RepID=A0A178MBA7_9PROT|nr:alpha/beta hydrolase [Magnetospirillum moscoviense]OAN46081.1 alpha/beta hydrolase [Magnetospirillum moscoviense]